MAEANRGLCPYVSNKTRLAQRRGGAEKGKNGEGNRGLLFTLGVSSSP